MSSLAKQSGTSGSSPAAHSSKPRVRRRVRALPGVELRERCEVLTLTTTPDRKHVIGVTAAGVDGHIEEALEADLVVAASGRSARLPAWLEELGYKRSRESVLDVDIGYASRNYRLQPGALTDKMVLIAPWRGASRGLALFAQEDDRWLLTLAGSGDDRPPTDEVAFDAFLETVAPPDVLVAVRAAEPLDEIATHRFPANRRRRYERMRRFPEGLLPIGDAICSFNPVYGQGMTVAALEAVALRRCLERGDRRLRRRYFRAVTRIVDDAWEAAITSDLALPGVAGRRSRSMRLAIAYLARLYEKAEEDGEMSIALVRVAGMLERPSRLRRPDIVWRGLRKRRSKSLVWPGRPLRTSVRRRTLRVDGIATPLREAGAADASEAVVFVHGNPGSGADFEPLLAAAGQVGRAVAWDAPGFGRADKPESFDQSVPGHAAFIGRALEELGIERAHLVLHDFGGAWGLAWAASAPERLASATLLGTGALLGCRWHRMARIWRTRGLGETVMAMTTRLAFRSPSAPLRRPHVRGLRSRHAPAPSCASTAPSMTSAPRGGGSPPHCGRSTSRRS